MTKLSVNINKVATLRNARGGNNPDLLRVAKDCERFGSSGITVHPRPDERHIRYDDVIKLSEILTTEFNIEGNPKSAGFIELVLNVKPTQVTLVPDTGNQLTSDHGWNTIEHSNYLTEIILQFREAGIRTSIFTDPDLKMIEGAKLTGTNRIELYTESYANQFEADREKAIKPFIAASELATSLGIGLNAGHDLSLANLSFFHQNIKNLLEVSIGHALICDALYVGLEEAIGSYRKCLE